MSLCKHCVSGSIHEGTPKGKTEIIDGHEVYVATPTKDYPKQEALLLLTDVYGLALNNNKVCDGFHLFILFIRSFRPGCSPHAFARSRMFSAADLELLQQTLY
jgi:hypothetical protein